MTTLNNIKNIVLRRETISYMAPTVEKLQRDEEKKKSTLVSQKVLEDMIKGGVESDRVHDVTEIKFYETQESKDPISSIKKYEDKVLTEPSELDHETILSKKTTTELVNNVVDEKIKEQESKIDVHKVRGIEFYGPQPEPPVDGTVQPETPLSTMTSFVSEQLPLDVTDEVKKTTSLSQYVIESMIQSAENDDIVNPLILTDTWNEKCLPEGIKIEQYSSGCGIVVEPTYPHEMVCIPKHVSMMTYSSDIPIGEEVHQVVGVSIQQPLTSTIISPFASEFTNVPFNGQKTIQTRGIKYPLGTVRIVCDNFKSLFVDTDEWNDLELTSISGGRIEFTSFYEPSTSLVRVELHGFKEIGTMLRINDLVLSKEVERITPGDFNVTIPNGSSLKELKPDGFKSMIILDDRVFNLVKNFKRSIPIHTLSEYVPEYEFNFKHNDNLLTDSIFKYSFKESDETYGFRIGQDSEMRYTIKSITKDCSRYYIPSKFVDENFKEFRLAKTNYTVTDDIQSTQTIYPSSEIIISDKNNKISLNSKRKLMINYSPDFSVSKIRCKESRLILPDQVDYVTLNCNDKTTLGTELKELVIGTYFFGGEFDPSIKYGSFKTLKLIYVPQSDKYDSEQIKTAFGLDPSAEVRFYLKYSHYEEA